MTSPIFQLSADSKTLAHVLRNVAVGDVIAFPELTSSIGRDVQASARTALETARRMLLREDRMVFGSVRGVGLKRLADDEILRIPEKTRDHIRRASRKTATALACVDYDHLTRDQQTKHNASLSMLAVIAELSTARASTRLEEKVADAAAALPAAKAAIAALGSVI